MGFGERLKELRLKAYLSQEELSKKVGITPRSVYNYERSDRVPSIEIVAKLANVLGVSIDFLTNGSEKADIKGKEKQEFIENAQGQFGYKGKREAQLLLERANALFAGGELSEQAKDDFFQSLTQAYFIAKNKARQKYSKTKKD